MIFAYKLRPYFLAHTITVLTNQPLRKILQKRETFGWLIKLTIELGEFDIHYQPQPAEKGYVIIDFISEFTFTTKDMPTKDPHSVLTNFSPTDHPILSTALPDERAEAKLVRYCSTRYIIFHNVLYRHSHSMSLLRYVIPQQGNYIIQEIHERACGDHSGIWSLAFKMVRQHDYWPMLHVVVLKLVNKCDQCQRFSSVPKLSAKLLTPIIIPLLFAQWGLDLIGPMPQGKRQVNYIVVVVDYFTKWVEVEAFTTVTVAELKHFV